MLGFVSFSLVFFWEMIIEKVDAFHWICLLEFGSYSFNGDNTLDTERKVVEVVQSFPINFQGLCCYFVGRMTIKSIYTILPLASLTDQNISSLP